MNTNEITTVLKTLEHKWRERAKDAENTAVCYTKNSATNREFLKEGVVYQICAGQLMEMYGVTAQLQKENEELRGQLSSTRDKLIEGSLIGIRKCADVQTLIEQVKQLQPQLTTARERSLREAMEVCKGMAASSESYASEFAHDKCRKAIQSLITTPASGCDCGCPKIASWTFCPYCDKPIAQVKGLGL